LQSARIKRLKSGGLVGFAKTVHILIKTVPAGIDEIVLLTHSTFFFVQVIGIHLFPPTQIISNF